MLIFPAIDLYEKKAVRLYKGDYNQMTVYNDNPLEVALDFKHSGATHIHMVDLEGAKSGTTPNLDVVCEVKEKTGLFVEVGGGIRSMKVIESYIGAGVDRVILGTAAVTDNDFLLSAVEKYGEKIAVGVDIKDGYVAVKGWTEKSDLEAFTFCEKMSNIGVKTLICTDISKDGAMMGANHDLYRELANRYDMQIIASGGVSSIDDVSKLAALDLYGAIIGKAYYTKAICLDEAIEVAK
ncbi:MAG: 1-(5-phosphoribosyl)-5-[(5-phosphoribosylamino)methylideneamino]imidazole-4-carboxamide isomerase [Acutalibacteraceae bacterium]|nr:1-(5-phosphoribosyl)-5-[(5-phosphoribosylamino)methylideneamino]imidazole-4-carboxamide isomerase [Clostridia bacterium]MEE1144491.1 1-(5-phosphoribosyl)-5-[(5-phosphoribosylamino)methylideneamino]imidazole-4-carboxamide isomerase [Acutalibacteraceae bacterium]